MKASTFEYVRPASLTEAVSVLADAISAGKTAQVLAGGQSILPMLNLRVTASDLLIDVSRLSELRSTTDGDADVRLGACITHAEIEDDRIPDPSRGMMPKVASNIAYRAVRTRGTIGGSLALSDPAADWVTVVPALGGRIGLVGPAGRREVDAGVFATGIYETVRQPDEILDGISVPKLSAQGRWGIAKYARKTGEFATCLVAAVLDPARGYARIVLGGIQGPPIVLPLAGEALRTSAALDDVRRAARDDLESCGHVFDDYQRSVHDAMISRAVSQVLG